ncbi:PACE efflux transporter [Vibrio lamellibrachiae]|uniref:PACE efflux transporter n=1 Tax=Vibrio lamellibrachiae TaxID=2910253 RepID=UPI003D0CEC4B
MTLKERIFHAVLFETLAIMIVIPLAVYFAKVEVKSMFIISVCISIYVMIWNVIYNLLFDRFFDAKKKQTSLLYRAFHTLFFILGVVAVTVPSIAWFLNISLLASLSLKSGLMIILLVYAFLFNTIYDKVRINMLAKYYPNTDLYQ